MRDANGVYADPQSLALPHQIREQGYVEYESPTEIRIRSKVGPDGYHGDLSYWRPRPWDKEGRWELFRTVGGERREEAAARVHECMRCGHLEPSAPRPHNAVGSIPCDAGDREFRHVPASETAAARLGRRRPG
ncbi:MAG: hypothetical protein ACK4N5_01375 [Myxococcales bacterium]